jgi:hypothetical protein
MPAFAPDRRHVRAIAAYCFAAFATGHSRFVGCEFMRGSLGVSCPATFARDFPLLGSIHRRKTALTGICHEGVSFVLQFWILTRTACPRVRPALAVHEICLKRPDSSISFCLENDRVGDVEPQKFLAVVSRLLATAYCKRATVP